VEQEFTARVNNVMGDDDESAPAAAPAEGAGVAVAARRRLLYLWTTVQGINGHQHDS
jgi:hypothetical protein